MTFSQFGILLDYWFMRTKDFMEQLFRTPYPYIAMFGFTVGGIIGAAITWYIEHNYHWR
jgi:esterase/lipase